MEDLRRQIPRGFAANDRPGSRGETITKKERVRVPPMDSPKVSRGEPSNPVRLGRHVRAESPSTSAVKPEYHIPSKRRTMEHPQMTGDVAGYTGYCSQQKPVPQGFRRVGANYLIRYSNAPLTLTRANGIVFNLQNKDGGRARRPLLCDNVYPTTSYTPFSSAPSYTLPNTVQASLSNSSSGYKILYNNVEADQSKTVHLMPIDNRGVQLIIPLSQPVQPVDHGKAIPPTETTYSLLSPPMSSRPSPAAQFSNGSEEFTLLEGSGYPSSSISVTPPAEKPTSLENDIDYALLDEFFVKQEQWH